MCYHIDIARDGTRIYCRWCNVIFWDHDQWEKYGEEITKQLEKVLDYYK